ncbi:NADH dehydrogenase subunit 5 [Alicyclobacillus tolerans]
MLTPMILHICPILFFVSLLLLICSGLFILHPRIPIKFVRFHVGLSVLPPFIALLNLLINSTNRVWGFWELNALTWLIAVFVLMIGSVVQRFSVRQMLGDRNYRKYFTYLTLITSSAALAWLSNDILLLLLFWGITLLGLTWLIRLNQEWVAAKNAALHTSRLFACSWFLFLLALSWLTFLTGEWQISLQLSSNHLIHLIAWQKNMLALLLVLAVIIPAAQVPFQRWLLDSVVAPTPISAVMHAGVVNAGAIILTRFSPVFMGEWSSILLIAVSSVSVLMGTGTMLVHVDYKRQLVGSTIAQMGFMFIQCALGAYLAAIIHAVLHGLFKSALFLQAGSAVHHKDEAEEQISNQNVWRWRVIGGIIGVLAGLGFWFFVHHRGYDWMSALLLGWSVAFAWSQIPKPGSPRITRILGLTFLFITLSVFALVFAVFFALLHGVVPQGIQPPSMVNFMILLVLLLSSGVGAWLARHPQSRFYVMIYLWLVQWSEPHRDSVESHPKYLTNLLKSRG